MFTESAEYDDRVYHNKDYAAEAAITAERILERRPEAKTVLDADQVSRMTFHDLVADDRGVRQFTEEHVLRNSTIEEMTALFRSCGIGKRCSAPAPGTGLNDQRTPSARRYGATFWPPSSKFSGRRQ